MFISISNLVNKGIRGNIRVLTSVRLFEEKCRWWSLLSASIRCNPVFKITGTFLVIHISKLMEDYWLPFRCKFGWCTSYCHDWKLKMKLPSCLKPSGPEQWAPSLRCRWATCCSRWWGGVENQARRPNPNCLDPRSLSRHSARKCCWNEWLSRHFHYPNSGRYRYW